MEVLYNANDNVIQLASLTNGLTSAAVTGATISCTLLTSTGAAVSGATGVSMVASTGAASTYRGTIPYSVSLTTGSTYTARITVTAGSLNGRWDVPVRAMARTS